MDVKEQLIESFTRDLKANPTKFLPQETLVKEFNRWSEDYIIHNNLEELLRFDLEFRI